ncbi:DNA repair protein RecN [Geoalkalibacter halelectricus]|uniref:DNA repair protein RecN n=1 Tax=Geoalkalibacter halelectricus TaxID=2847045 RepID=A0ABY5ZQG0_9BACT|nr:DNA repair protein RecN [Geoalkalibacter halelectricus]MDO3376717.1 DNA repair protein RecN [Geoalkalibacter halelectricus]UWZ81331.1 DNA repair protein RecN [Geoalkalibacter halelectricus]
MLTDLNIRNFAIIDQLHVSFGPGFNVLTGETGAGKSILLGAVGLLLGERARSDVVRSGEEEASVEAVFELHDAAREDVGALLAEAGIEDAQDEILIRRLFSRSGKNRIFINGCLVTLAQLQPIAEKLVTIYGQHEHQSLLRAETHLAALDTFADNAALRDEYQQTFRRLQQCRERLRALQVDERDRQSRLDLLRYQSQEITAANLELGEDEQLETERRLLQHAERLAAATGGGFERLYGQEGAACELVEQTAAELEALTAVDERLSAPAGMLREALYTLEDAAAQLRNYSTALSFDSERQNEVESRLAALAALKRKYGASLSEILKLRDQLLAELEQIDNLDGAREDLGAEITHLEEALRRVGEKLSERRREAGRLLEQRVEAQLADLSMAQARFLVVFQPSVEPLGSGLEKCEFHLAPNPGEEPRPLGRIASGGELSRIMLALRRAAPQQEAVATLIFDEVDAGIGGATATRVGEKLRALARDRQVLCVTHLPQVAAFGDRQYHIEKCERDGRTRTAVALLEGEERIREMARMLGGARITERTLEHARELIAQSA